MCGFPSQNTKYPVVVIKESLKNSIIWACTRKIPHGKKLYLLTIVQDTKECTWSSYVTGKKLDHKPKQLTFNHKEPKATKWSM